MNRVWIVSFQYVPGIFGPLERPRMEIRVEAGEDDKEMAQARANDILYHLTCYPGDWTLIGAELQVPTPGEWAAIRAAQAKLPKPTQTEMDFHECRKQSREQINRGLLGGTQYGV